MRKSPNLDGPTFGGSIQGRLKELLLEATYVSQGPKAWQLSASNTSLLKTPHGVGGLSVRLTGLRPESEAVPIEDSLLLAAAPQLQIFPWGEKQFPVGISMNRPYLLTGLTVESPVTELDLRPSFRFGLGTEMNLFGLYPSDISLGVEVDSAATATWKFGIKGIRF